MICFAVSLVYFPKQCCVLWQNFAKNGIKSAGLAPGCFGCLVLCVVKKAEVKAHSKGFSRFCGQVVRCCRVLFCCFGRFAKC